MNAQPSIPHVAPTRAQYEDFLFQEAALLDEWRLDEWLALFASDGTYEVPTAGAADDVDSSEELFYISDDYARLGHRIDRLKKTDAHSEFPRSDGVRLVSNVRILESSSDGDLVVSKFITYRAKNDITDAFFGHHIYRLRMIDGAIKIASKRTMLDMNTLRPQGRISIVL